MLNRSFLCTLAASAVLHLALCAPFGAMVTRPADIPPYCRGHALPCQAETGKLILCAVYDPYQATPRSFCRALIVRRARERQRCGRSVSMAVLRHLYGNCVRHATAAHLKTRGPSRSYTKTLVYLKSAHGRTRARHIVFHPTLKFLRACLPAFCTDDERARQSGSRQPVCSGRHCYLPLQVEACWLCELEGSVCSNCHFKWQKRWCFEI